jgi:hypothetical protein
MAKQLAYQPLTNLGVNGLNTQYNPSTLDATWLTAGDNVILRESGRISFRKGFKQKVVPTGTAIGSMVEHNDQSESPAVNKIFASHGTSIYIMDFTSPNAAFPTTNIDVRHTVSGSSGNWQFVNFNNRLHCFHSGVVPQRYDGSSDALERWSSHYTANAINDGSGIDASVTTITADSTLGFPPNGKIKIESEIISYTGKTPTTFTGCTRGADSTSAATHADDVAIITATVPAGVTTFDPSCGMGFYGRMFAGGVTEEKDVVYYSTLLDGDDWTGTGSGSIDLKTVWGTDEILHIAPFFGKLIIFGKNNIAIYDNPADIANATLDEVITGIGLVNRDTVQAVGDDLVFLSATGLRSLSRTTEKDKLPLTDYSVNIKDTLIRNIGQSTETKSVYLEGEGVYILTFTEKNITYVFDFKHFTPNKVPRVTTWSFNLDREPASMIDTKLYSGLLVGQKDGSIAGYEEYFDRDLAWVDSAISYTNASISSNISSTWIQMGEALSASILKKMILVLEGGSGAIFYLKWYKDFSINPSTTTSINLNPATSGTTSLWGATTSRYGTTTVTHTHDATLHPSNSTYAPIYGLKEYRTALTGSAKHLKLNLSISSNGYDASIQNLSIISKEGKIR